MPHIKRTYAKPRDNIRQRPLILLQEPYVVECRNQPCHFDVLL